VPTKGVPDVFQALGSLLSETEPASNVLESVPTPEEGTLPSAAGTVSPAQAAPVFHAPSAPAPNVCARETSAASVIAAAIAKVAATASTQRRASMQRARGLTRRHDGATVVV
jgi:hypothetical protein